MLNKLSCACTTSNISCQPCIETFISYLVQASEVMSIKLFSIEQVDSVNVFHLIFSK